MNYSVVQINGSNYYVANNLLNDLIIIDNKLVNFGTSTIYLYQDIPSQSENNTYPYIRINSMKTATYYESDRSNHELNVALFEIIKQPINYSVESIYIYFAILGVLICQLFKR